MRQNLLPEVKEHWEKMLATVENLRKKVRHKTENRTKKLQPLFDVCLVELIFVMLYCQCILSDIINNIYVI